MMFLKPLSTLLISSLLLLSNIHCSDNIETTMDVQSLLKNIAKEKTINKEWPFSICGEYYDNDVNQGCPKNWHCSKGSCLPDEPDSWKYKVLNVEFIRHISHFGKVLYFTKLTLAPFSYLTYKNNVCHVEIYTMYIEELSKEEMILKLFPYDEEFPRYEVFVPILGLSFDTVQEREFIDLRMEF